MKAIKKEQLKEWLDKDQVHLIEVLSEEQYDEMHIKGAINIPLKRIGKEAREKFDKGDTIVVYCSDHECQSSPSAAKKLEDLGFNNVYDYEGGKKEWKEAGLPMEGEKV